MKTDFRSLRQHRRPGQIQDLLRVYRQSHQTQRAFAQQHGVSLATLTSWLRRFPVPPAAPVAWAEVKRSAPELPPRPASAPSVAGYQVVLANGTVLRLPPDFDPLAVRQLVQQLLAV